MNYKIIFNLGLKLYPSAFRDEFADEMLNTFVACFDEHQSHWDKLKLISKELLDNIWTAFLLHIQSSREWYLSLTSELQTLYQARWIIRIASLLNVLFFIVVTLDPYLASPKPENLLMLVLFLIQFVCVLFALRWERIGGIIMLTTTFTITPMTFFGTLLPGFEYLSLFATLLWGLPFASFAIGYLVIGQRQELLERRMYS